MLPVACGGKREFYSVVPKPGTMSFKVDSFVRPFSCASGEDFQEFWGKFVVLCNIQKWSSDAEQVQFLPLFLKGDAFLVFSRLADGDKKEGQGCEGEAGGGVLCF